MANKLRLNDEKRAILLRDNDGYRKTTSYSGKNFSETNTYTIKNGTICVRSQSNTSWADSREDREYQLEPDGVKRFLREHLHELDISGIIGK